MTQTNNNHAMPAAYGEGAHDWRLHDAAWLHAVHHDARCGLYDIAKICGVTKHAVREALRRSGVAFLSNETRNPVRYPELRDATFLIHHLVTLGESLGQVARLIECGETAVREAVARDDMREALLAAGWQAKRNAVAAQWGHLPKISLPSDDELCAGVQRLTSLLGRPVSRRELVASFQGDAGFDRRLGVRIKELVCAGRIQKVSVQEVGMNAPRGKQFLKANATQ